MIERKDMSRGLIVPLDGDEKTAEDVLVPIRSRKILSRSDGQDDLQQASTRVLSVDQPFETILETLRFKPDDTALNSILIALQRTDGPVHIHVPSPRLAQIINVLVDETIPDWWPQLSEPSEKSLKSIKSLLTQALRTVTGIGALLNRIRNLCTSLGSQKRHHGVDSSILLKILVSVCGEVLQGDDIFRSIHSELAKYVTADIKRLAAWREVLMLLASGKALSVVAAADDCIKKTNGQSTASWLADGSMYATWLGRNIHYMLESNRARGNPDIVEVDTATAQLISKALTFTHRGKRKETIQSDSTDILQTLLSPPFSSIRDVLLTGCSSTRC